MQFKMPTVGFPCGFRIAVPVWAIATPGSPGH
jgi:hypothetical protein